MLVKDEGNGTYTLDITQEMSRALIERRIFRYAEAQPAAETVRVLFQKDMRIEPYSGFYSLGPLASMGAFSYTHSPLAWNLTVGRYCSIASRVEVFGEQHPVDRATTSVWSYRAGNPIVGMALADLGVTDFPMVPPVQKPPPTIGNDVWIGADVRIAGGITVGDGAIIGAGAIVTRNVDPFCIVAGNPARTIRRRFSDEICERFSRVRWWDYAIGSMPRPQLTDPARFIEQVEEWVAAGVLLAYQPPVLDAIGLIALARQVEAGEWTPGAQVAMPSRQELFRGIPNADKQRLPGETLYQAISRLQREGRYEELDAVFGAAEPSEQDDHACLSVWCTTPRIRNNPAEAMRRAERMIQLHPDRPDSYYHRLYALRPAVGYDAAIEYYQVLLARFGPRDILVGPMADIAIAARDWPAVEQYLLMLERLAPQGLDERRKTELAAARANLARVSAVPVGAG